MTCAEHLKAWLDAIDGDEKFIMCAAAGIVSSIFFACGILTENGWLIAMGGSVFAYVSGKVVEDRSKINAIVA